MTLLNLYKEMQPLLNTCQEKGLKSSNKERS